MGVRAGARISQGIRRCDPSRFLAGLMFDKLIGDPRFVFQGSDDPSSVYATRFAYPVLEHTAQLFAILEWADHAAGHDQPFVGDPPEGHAPAGMSVSLVSVPIDECYSAVTEAGSEGRLAQLAYKGWIVLLAGLWERFRQAEPIYDRQTGPPMGLLATLYGDIQKIRNDVLKNNGVAKNSARCELLNWFDKEETIRFNVDHVLEILHHMGHPLRTYLLFDSDRRPAHTTGWRVRSSRHAPTPRLAGRRLPRWRVVSTRVIVTELEEDSAEHTLGISIMFADGVVGSFLIESSNDSSKLIEWKQAIERAPKDEYGCPLIPGLGQAGIPEMHQMALQQLSNGNPPVDPGTPAMRFTALTDND